MANLILRGNNGIVLVKEGKECNGYPIIEFLEYGIDEKLLIEGFVFYETMNSVKKSIESSKSQLSYSEEKVFYHLEPHENLEENIEFELVIEDKKGNQAKVYFVENYAIEH